MRFQISDFRFQIAACAIASLLIASEAACAADSRTGAVENRKSKIENPPSPLAAATIVVFNSRDIFSTDLAGYYAKKRGIPPGQIVGLDCPIREEISREEYDRHIAEPLRKIFAARGWWKMHRTPAGLAIVEENKIRFVAIMYGVPLKIAPAADYEGDSHEGVAVVRDHNEAAVDSELACLGFFSRHISGALNNPYYRSPARFLDTRFPPLMLVCRLDAADPKTVRRMIDDSIEAEQKGLWGFACIDERGITEGALAEGDEWLRRAAEECRRRGLPVIVDDGPEMFPAGYPLRNVALYFGWYSERAGGPFARDDFRFAKGAVAVHIHSSSAVSLRNPHEYWAAPLLDRGAAATLGNVYEPYLALTPNLDVFNARLLAGFTFAESAYASERVVSWMTTFVGDPLYRPFRAVSEMFGEQPAATEWSAYREGASLWFLDRAAGEKKLRESARALGSGAISEGLGLLQNSVGNGAAAGDSFALARKFYTHPDDILRVTIHEVKLLLAGGKKSEAVALAEKQMRANPRAGGCEVLRSLLPELAPKAR